VRGPARFSVLVLSLAVVALAQERGAVDKPAAAKPPEQQVGGLHFVDVAEVTIVNVDVTVRDKDKPVLDLRRADFEIYQDGKPQDVTNFALYSGEGPPVSPTPRQPLPPAVSPPVAAPPAVATPTAEREPRFVALYIDNQNILPLDRNRVLNKLKDLARENLHPPDQMMVVSYQRSLKVIQSFTSIPEDITTALNVLKTYTGGRSDIISSRHDIEEFIHDNANNPDEIGGAVARADAFARQERNDLTFTIRSLQDLITTMSGLPGKKAIIYVSDGLPMVPGQELFYDIQDEFNDTSVLSEAQTYASMDLFQGLVTSAAAAGVTLYTIDGKGLETALGNEAENRYERPTLAASVLQSNYQDSLRYMADETGGLAIVNTNDVGPGLKRIVNDLDTYYSLGYRLIPSGRDRPHRIEVKVKGHPEYKLAYKPMFIEKTLPTRIADRVISGLAYDLADNPLDIDLSTSEPQPSSNGRWLLPVAVRVPLDRIALIPDGDDLTGYIMVYYVARDDEGKESDLQRTEHPIKLPRADYDQAKGRVWTVTASLLLDPGTYRISVGVRDELTNQAGYAAVRRAVHPEAASQ
jgi:VWFA-related protein